MMIDNQSVTDLVSQEIANVVDRYVSTIIKNQEWQTALEDRITKYVQDRIAARFVNVSSVSGLVDTITGQVNYLFEQGQIPGIDKFVDHAKIRTSMDSAIQHLVQNTLDQLVIDQDWLAKISDRVDQHMAIKVTERLSEIDLNTLLVSEIDRGINRWQHRLKQNFQTNGIMDAASSCQLTVSDGLVKIESMTESTKIKILASAEVGDTLHTKNLVVTGSINTDCASWNELAAHVADIAQQKLNQDWRDCLIEQVVKTVSDNGIDFDDVMIEGVPLITGHMLNANITDTGIQKLGTLRDLNVAGKTHLSGTLCSENKRVGINTESPEMALGIWDEEVSLIFGKMEKDHAFVGTSRQQSLSLGINRRSAVTIDSEGLTSIKKLRVDRWHISHGNAVPGWSGTRGDLVFNHDPKPGAPFAWVCLGAFKWQELRSA